ncbi:hypothetical protein PCCS19_38740 [Paenibacillus sp. CCS19]|nr:hypothetical protein PCCS19_38740 [Paenibacillus cellulosilyticus]
MQIADIPAPYLFVGHSIGAIYARRYAQLYPDEVAGYILLDPAHEGLLHAPKVRKRDKPLQIWNTLRVLLQYKRIYRPLFEQALSEWPKPIREQLIGCHLRSQWTMIQEGRNLSSTLYQEMIRDGSVPDVPVIVLTALEIDPMQAVTLPDSYLQALNDFKNHLNTVFAKSVSNGENRAINNAGHSWIHINRLDAVSQAVSDLMDQLKRCPK